MRDGLFISGVFAGVEPHQPIPNLVVKGVRRDNTYGVTRWKDNVMPGKYFLFSYIKFFLEIKKFKI